MKVRVRNLGKCVIPIILLLVIGSVFKGSFIELKLDSTSTDKNILKVHSSSQSFVVHPPIVITNNGAFGSYNFSGTGTRGDPYLIEGYNITSQGVNAVGIEIRNTNYFFVINACVIYSDWVGILLNNVADGTSKIISNIMISLTGDGGGIGLGDMRNCTMIENICTNFMQGIHLNNVDDSIIYYNYIYDSNYQGVNIRYSDSNLITHNRIRNSKEHGLALVGTSSNNEIHHNIFEGNAWSDTYKIDGVPKGSPSSQGYDEGSNNRWYDSRSYYGNGWSDYFGIGTYEIDGPANSIDLYPNSPTGFTLFSGIVIYSSIVIGFVVFLAIYLVYYRRRQKF
ncbi:MAG: right-handed parallel beta-helix repeat-containing protein [Candidatus Hermodarchaeota archaeon]